MKWSQPLLAKFLLVCAALSQIGCGYQHMAYRHEGSPKALAIPVIRDDEDGRLRNALAKHLATSNRFTYSASSDARYQLIVKVEKDSAETVGYMWDRNPITGKIINRLYPSEGRRNLVASITVMDTETQKPLLKPFKVQTQSDYDFVNPTVLQNIEFTDLHGEKQTVLQYSLGQLDSEEGARAEAADPLLDALAKEIARTLVRAPLN